MHCVHCLLLGAIYGGRDWGGRGVVIRYNYIHDIFTIIDGYGVHGIYLDDCLSGITVTGNIIVNTTGLGILHGGGRDNIMTNNIVIGCNAVVGSDNRGTVWIKNDSSDWDLLNKIKAYNYQSPPWSVCYPSLASIPNSWSFISNSSWLCPGGCDYSLNVGHNNTRNTSESEWSSYNFGVFVHFKRFTDNYYGDPMFVDLDNRDFRFKSNSPVLKLPGFKPIPFDRIGVGANDVHNENTSSGCIMTYGLLIMMMLMLM